jgi:hypothetical protein
MTAKRAAVYSGGAVLLLAWMSAAGVRQTPEIPAPVKPVETTGTASLAADVQAQTIRLRSRLAAAPAPQEPARNPFAFVGRDPAKRHAARPAAPAAAPVQPLPPPEPAIQLIGVAESNTPKGAARTAIISALSGELFLVKEGETIAGRYRVGAVGTDAVELNDLMQGTVRRLALKD